MSLPWKGGWPTAIFVQDDPEGIQVGALIDPVLQQHLGRRVLDDAPVESSCVGRSDRAHPEPKSLTMTLSSCR